MDFIIGGAYQGKLDYAKKIYSLNNNDIFTCTEDGGIIFGSRCICKLEEFTLWCAKTQKDALKIFEEHRNEWQDSILICADIFCGVVPMGAEMRKWREETGKLCAFLSGEADTVTRLFCGLPQPLKPAHSPFTGQ